MAFRLIALLWLLVGLGVLGYGLFLAHDSWRFVQHPETQKAQAHFTGYKVKLTQKDSTNRRHGAGTTVSWFPEPTFELNGRKFTDPNIMLFRQYAAGDMVPVAVRGNLARIDDFHARYASAALLIIIGLFSVILGRYGWSSAAEASVALSPFWDMRLDGLGIKDTPMNVPAPFGGLTPRLFLKIAAGFLVLAVGVPLSFAIYNKVLKPPSIHELIDDKNRAGVLELISNQGKLDEPSIIGQTALYRYSQAGDLEMVNALLSAGASLECEYAAPLLVAITQKHGEVALLLVAAGAALDERYGEGITLGDGSILYGLPRVTRAIAKREGPFSAPPIFIDLAVQGSAAHEPYLAQGGDSELRFGKMTLKRWLELVRAEASAGS